VGCPARADAGGVSAEGDVAAVVQAVLDGPFRAGEGGEPGRAGLGRGQAGDAERGDIGAAAAVQAADVAFDQEDLRRVREREVFGGRQHLDGAGLVAAAPAIAVCVRDRGVFPWQGVDRREQAGEGTKPGPGRSDQMYRSSSESLAEARNQG